MAWENSTCLYLYRYTRKSIISLPVPFVNPLQRFSSAYLSTRLCCSLCLQLVGSRPLQKMIYCIMQALSTKIVFCIIADHTLDRDYTLYPPRCQGSPTQKGNFYNGKQGNGTGGFTALLCTARCLHTTPRHFVFSLPCSARSPLSVPLPLSRVPAGKPGNPENALSRLRLGSARSRVSRAGCSKCLAASRPFSLYHAVKGRDERFHRP